MQTSRKLTRTLLALFALAMMAVSALADGSDDPTLYPRFSEVSDQKAGSILFYNFYTSSPTGAAGVNTRINMTNTFTTGGSVFVHLFFVGSNCTAADSYICLTKNQTVSFLMSDIDPGTTGYILAVATDEFGCPVGFNYLIGDEYIKLASGHTANLGAEAIASIFDGTVSDCSASASAYTLKFTGYVQPPKDNEGNEIPNYQQVGYNKVPSVLAADNIPSRADGNDTLLVVNAIGGNLLSAGGGASVASLFGLLYDDTEVPYSYSVFTSACQLVLSLSNTGVRVPGRFEGVIPAGRTGWTKIYSSTGARAFLGSELNFNANAGTAAGAFTGGHNLHKLTLAPSASITIPVFPATCGN